MEKVYWRQPHSVQYGGHEGWWKVVTAKEIRKK